MKPAHFFAMAATVAALLSCAEMQAAPPPPTMLPAKGSHFDSVGRVFLHAGRPCTSQIMFDFHGRTVVWLAAPKRETALLTEAVKHKQKVRVSGVWRRGASAGCAFVEVTGATVEKRFLGIF